MRVWLLFTLTALLLPLEETSPSLPGAPGVEPRFTSLEIFIDSRGVGLSAYQVEIVCNPEFASVVGVEGGEVKAFSAAPAHDPSALHETGGGRLVLAAFTLLDSPPPGRVRVARVHFVERGGSGAGYGGRLMAAGDVAGNRIEASLEIVEGKRRP